MAFADAAAKPNTRKFMALRISLPISGAYSTYELRVAPEQFYIGGAGLGTFHPYLVDHSEITMDAKGFGAGIVDISDFTATLADGELMNAPYGTLISHLFEVYQWINAVVNVYLVCQDEDDAYYASAIWRGALTGHPRINQSKIEIEAKAMTELDCIVPTATLDKTTFPDVPDGNAGLAQPIVYGDFLPEPVNAGKSDAWNLSAERMGLARLTSTIPALCYDAGKALMDTAYFRIAGCTIKALATGANQNAYINLPELGQMAPILNPTFDLGAGHADLALDYWTIFSAAITPQGINAANTTTAPTLACDKNIVSYVSMDHASGTTTLALDFTRPPDLGYINAIKLYVAFHNYETLAGYKIEYGLWDPGAAWWWGGRGTIPVSSSGSDEIKIYTVTAPTPAAAYATDIPDGLYIRIQLVSVTPPGPDHGVCTVAETAVIVEYKARSDQWIKYSQQNWRSYTPEYQTRSHGRWIMPMVPLDEFLKVDQSAQSIFVGCQGRKDVSGVITGTVNQLMEQPAHILYDFLVSYARYVGVTTGAHGDFDVAGDDQATAVLKMAFEIGKQSKAREIVEQICRQSGMIFYVRADGKPAVVWWGSSVADNLYGDPIPYADIYDLEITKTELADVRNVFRAQYEYDYCKRKCLKVCYFDGDGQDDGLGGSLNGPVSLTPYGDSEDRYGRRELALTLDWIRHQPTACKVRNMFGEMQVEPRVHLRMKLPWKYYDLEIGHVVEADDYSWRIAGHRYPGSSTGGAGPGYWTFGPYHHYFWIERVTHSKKGYVEVEATEGVW